jgi:hypothetical protein
MDYTTRDFMKYLSIRSGIEDQIHLEYLAFLTQHDIYNLLVKDVVVMYTHHGQPISRSQFYIGYEAVVQLEDQDTEESSEHRLPQSVARRIDETVYKYGTKKRWELATHIRKKLKLEPREKQKDYIGKKIDQYLRIEGFKVIKKEI